MKHIMDLEAEAQDPNLSHQGRRFDVEAGPIPVITYLVVTVAVVLCAVWAFAEWLS